MPKSHRPQAPKSLLVESGVSLDVDIPKSSGCRGRRLHKSCYDPVVLRGEPADFEALHKRLEDLCMCPDEKGIRMVVPVKGQKWATLAEIWAKSVARTNPNARVEVFEYGDTCDVIRLTEEGKGDFAKARASAEYASLEDPVLIMDADTMFVLPFRHNPPPDTMLSMYEQHSPPGQEHAAFHDVILEVIEDAGFDVSNRIVVASWVLWTRVDLSECWVRWYEHIYGLMSCGGKNAELVAKSPGLIIWNLVWYEYYAQGKTSPLRSQKGPYPIQHVWVLPQRIQAAKDMWKHNFGEEYE